MIEAKIDELIGTLRELTASNKEVLAFRQSLGATATAAPVTETPAAAESAKKAAGKGGKAKGTPKPAPEPEPEVPAAEEEEEEPVDLGEEEEEVVTLDDIRKLFGQLNKDNPDKTAAITKAFNGTLRAMGALTAENKVSLAKLPADQCAAFKKAFVAAVEAA